MMATRTQDQYVAERRERWKELDSLLADKEQLHKLPADKISRVAALFRSTCSDLMRARSAGYDPELVAYLDGLVARAHNRLYGARPAEPSKLLRFVTHTFPKTLREHARFLAASGALFVIPMIIGIAIAILSPEVATTLLPKSMLEAAAESYAEGLDGRSEGQDSMMAGFYVYNNVGIAFRCFATGIFFGLGSVFFLVYNGLVIGTVIGWVIMRGHGENILTFVCGHAPFELTAIVIAGGAGLQMGYSLVRTHGQTRLASLRAQAPAVGCIVGGAAIMLLVAALIEGFWSPSSVAPQIKWIVAGVLSVGVTLWLTLSGREGSRR